MYLKTPIHVYVEHIAITGSDVEHHFINFLVSETGSDGLLLNLVETQRRGVGLDEKMGY
jgi:hypothetical protein